jgi:hypothetical protein
MIRGGERSSEMIEEGAGLTLTILLDHLGLCIELH